MRRMFIAPLLILGTLVSAPAFAADAGETLTAQPPVGNGAARHQAVHQGRQASRQPADQTAAPNGAPTGVPPAATPSTTPAPPQGKGATPPRRTTKPIYGDIIIRKR